MEWNIFNERDYVYYFLVHCVFLAIITVIIIIYQENWYLLPLKHVRMRIQYFLPLE